MFEDKVDVKITKATTNTKILCDKYFKFIILLNLPKTLLILIHIYNK